MLSENTIMMRNSIEKITNRIMEFYITAISYIAKRVQNYAQMFLVWLG